MLFVLSLVHALKQQFNEFINGKSQTNRDQKSNLSLHNDIINIEEFDSNILKRDKKSNTKGLIFTILDTLS